MDSVFLRENRGHLSENLSTKNYSFGAKMRIIRRLPPNGSHPLRIPRNTRAQVKLAKSLAWPKEWGPCCVAFGRAYGSHPYETTSHGLGSLPIQQSDFPDFPLKIEYHKNPFFITFLIEKWPIRAYSSAGSARGPVICPLFWAGGSHGSHPVRIPFY